jgi:hypothetical protein
MTLLLLACAGAPDDTGAPVPIDTDSDDTGWTGPCPPRMVLMKDFCIDPFENTLDAEDLASALGPYDQSDVWPDTSTTAVALPLLGMIPTVDLSWYQAYGACLATGKHLCTVTEWQTACGEGMLPWGESPLPEEVCAIPAADGTTEWTELQPTGSLSECRSPEGVYDQIGNAWEWADPESVVDGVPQAAKLGGAFYAGPGNAGCQIPPMLDHPPEFSGTIAARCCVGAR